MQKELEARIVASRLGPARPRAIECEGAGGSVIPSQSRPENFSALLNDFQRQFAFKQFGYSLAELAPIPAAAAAASAGAG